MCLAYFEGGQYKNLFLRLRGDELGSDTGKEVQSHMMAYWL